MVKVAKFDPPNPPLEGGTKGGCTPSAIESLEVGANGHWFVYLLRCKNGSLYTGITTDVTRRVQEHNEGKGAKYTRLNKPVELVYVERTASRSSALIRELAIKRLKRKVKLELINSASNSLRAP